MIENILEKLKDTNPLVVGIGGASASGKSHLAAELQDTLRTDQIAVTVVNQDDFSIGKNFAGKHTSRYRWDDPEYYRLDECRCAIEALKAGYEFPFTAYNLIDHDAVDPVILGPLPAGKKNVIILEGIFAWYPPLDKIVDFKIFTSANFFKRFILRANRNVNQIKNTDFNTVVRQYFSHVMYAEQDLIAPMAAAADITAPLEINVATVVDTSDARVLASAYRGAQVVYKDAEVTLLVFRAGRQRVRMLVMIEGSTIFDETLTPENVQLLSQGGFIKTPKDDIIEENKFQGTS